ncbi:unnamed protein product [Microthlaspi erraticum]|uniref:MADS-box domain-containing protein n=1 Tax=Microthlaspi erraticum TaxID=1685480 RepID=A0A6D2HQF2_9BRAS|nr:unnamed protein product [Microthlaspi erraticum]CAA7017181.1 unnamed protein product [Microthlaspi erraticum]
MTRQKVKMVFIENDSARKSTFKKRKKGILKKAHELATLCDVPIGIVIGSPYDSTPEVWPTRESMDKVLSQWKAMSAMDKSKKMMNQESFLRQRINKATESRRKLCKENRELEMKEVMFDCLKGNTSPSRVDPRNLRDLGGIIEQHLKDINRRIDILKKNDEPSSSSVLALATPTAPYVMPRVEMPSSSSAVGFYDKIREQIETSMNKEAMKKDLDLNQKQC